MNETKTNIFLENEKTWKLMLKYSIPCIISMLMAAFYNIIDQIFIANASYLGSYGNAANTVVFPMTVVATAIAVMIGDGCCTFASINQGKGDNEKAALGIGSSLTAVTIISLIITLLYLIFQSPILTAFGARVNIETFNFSKEYFFWITLGIPFFMIGQALNPIIRFDGSPNFAMITMVIGIIINTILDPLFIFVFNWGMKGAAIATIIGQFITFIAAVLYLFKMKTVKLKRKHFNIKSVILKQICVLGSTSFLSQAAIVISMAAVLNMVVKYAAKDPVFSHPEYAQIPAAITGIVSKFFQITISISVGLAAGCIPILGYNIGAKRYDRILELFKLLITAQFIAGLISSIIFLLFPNQLMLLFGSKNESIYYNQFAVWFIRAQLFLLPIACINKASFIFLQAIGRPKESSLLSFMREIVFGAGIPILLPLFFGLYALPLFMPISDALTFIGVILVLLKLNAHIFSTSVKSTPPNA